MKTLRIAAWLLLTLGLLLAGGLAIGLRHPSLAPYQALWLPPAKAGAGLKVRFLGVSTLLFDDGETAFMTDGFFSRPGALQTALGRVAPDRAAIGAALAAAKVQKLAGLVVLHSHYDHAMDAPMVAQLSGAQLFGSASTANIARGQGLSPRRMSVIGPEGGSFRLGRFEISLLKSAHTPEDHFPGLIAAPLTPPSRASAYKTGDCYSLLIRHDGRSLLVQSSAGFIPGALKGQKAEVVLLGVGLLGKQDAAFRERYWREVVAGVGARRVIPIHWDDFFQPLIPLQPLPRLADNFPASMEFLLPRARQDGVDLRLPPAVQAFDPFAGL